jgi:N-acetyl-gamma-glutamyl-phosphate reductase common form
VATNKIPAIVLGGTGYVSGELLRLILGHPNFTLAGVMSDSSPGELAGKSFPHLAGSLGDTAFKSQADIAALIAHEPTSAVFCAAPHGAAAALIDSLLKAAEGAGTKPRFVDISADFRFATAAAYEAVYKHPHGAPQRIAQFTCAVPEHLKTVKTQHVGHPGCFSTSILLASVPLLKSGWVEPTLFVSGVTGSTGSGRKPVEGTHHPTRHSDLYSYGALGHRHTPEITALAKAASGIEADYSFVPHSGPFARGIHATVQAKLKSPRDAAAAVGMLREFYAGCPFVRVLDTAPRVKDIVASNCAHLSASANGRTIAVMCTVDNLNKGAAGGAVQWMNRLFDLPETAGLTAPAPGWT